MRRLLVIFGLALLAASCAMRCPHCEARFADNPLGGLLCSSACESRHVSVLIFTATDCPISNRYAPTVRKIVSRFDSKTVHFQLIYPDPTVTAEAIAEHRKAYRYPCEGQGDPEHRLVGLTGARVTPEAVVINPSGAVVYRGRIDNRYEDFGEARPEATTRDLESAIEAVLAGRPVEQAVTRAVGCYISSP